MPSYNRTVLHVNDDPHRIHVIAESLGRHNCDVDSVSGFASVLKQVQEGTYRVVLLDFDSRMSDGLTLLRELKREDSSIQVILLVDSIPVTTAMEAMRIGVEACILNPLDSTDSVYRAIEKSFEKIDQWWAFLSELSKQKRSSRHAATAKSS